MTREQYGQMVRILSNESLIMKLLNKFSKVRFGKVSKAEIVYFDLIGLEVFEDFLKQFTYHVQPARGEYYPLNFEILSFLLRGFLRGVFKKSIPPYLSRSEWLVVCYHKACIEFVCPKLVVSFVDNCKTLSSLTDLLKSSIHFIAVQNGTRWYYHYSDGFPLTYDTLLSFGSYEASLLKSMGHQLSKSVPVGSFRMDMAIERFGHPNSYRQRKKYDVCLVSQFKDVQNRLSESWHMQVSHALLLEQVSKALKKYGFRLVIALSGSSPKEESVFRKYFDRQVDIVRGSRFNLLSYELSIGGGCWNAFYLIVRVFRDWNEDFVCKSWT